MDEIWTAIAVAILATIVGLVLRKPAQNLVIYLRTRTPRQQNILIAIAFMAVVIEIIIFRKH